MAGFPLRIFVFSSFNIYNYVTDRHRHSTIPSEITLRGDLPPRYITRVMLGIDNTNLIGTVLNDKHTVKISNKSRIWAVLTTC